MNKEEFKQLSCTDQVSCNGVSGLVLANSGDEVRIQFDGESGATVLSSKDLAEVSDLRLVRKGTPMQFSEPKPRGLFPRGFHTRTDRPLTL